jgi:hypothetical protein
MKSQKLRSVAELVVLLVGALLLSAQGIKHVIGVLASASTLPVNAYGAGELTGQLIGAVCPLLIGISLTVIAYRHGFMSRVRAHGV